MAGAADSGDGGGLQAQLRDWFDQAPPAITDLMGGGSDQASHDGGMKTKAEANYRPAEDDTQCCGTCTHFTAPSTCDMVAGKVEEGHVSDEWEKGDGGDSSGSGSASGGTSPDSGDTGSGTGNGGDTGGDSGGDTSGTDQGGDQGGNQ